MKKFFFLALLVCLFFPISVFSDAGGGLQSPAQPVQAPDQLPNGLVVLLTDYGNRDFYVGAIKGAIYSKFPGARIDFITNEVAQFNVREGAYILAHAAREFPPGTVFCIVVDPGVGTKRKPVAVETDDGRYYVAPDNGVLTYILEQAKVKEAREITNPLFMRNADSLSSTFHGRDIFGPASAELARGVPIETAGSPVSKLVTFGISPPVLDKDVLKGEVEHVDWYGNVHTNIPASLLDQARVASGRTLRIQIGSETVVVPFVKTYGDVREGEWLALVNSAGVLEIARNRASANAILQVGDGSRVRVNL